MIWRRVRSFPSWSGWMTGALGSFSWTPDMISTRLIESMPRSDSMSMSRLSISAGYPVFSLTICRMTGTMSPAGAAIEAVAAAGIGVEAVPAGWTPMNSMIWRRVRSLPSWSGWMTGAPGSFSWTPDMISTRLIESMPRSDSMSMSRLSISAGYPVFSLTICRMTGTMSPAGAAIEAVAAAGIGVEAVPAGWTPMNSMIWRRVRSLPSWSGWMTGAPGSFSWTPDMISTRLIESMPRSDSISISILSISAG